MPVSLPGSTTATDQDFGYGQLLAILLRRRFWFLGVFCSVLTVAAVMTLGKQPTYQSSLQLLVEPNYQDKGVGKTSEGNQFTDSSVEIDYATQLNLMRSSQLIQKAVVLLQPEYPTISVGEIRESLLLEQVANDKVSTKIFQVGYTDNDPVKTQAVLKALQKVYQNYNLEQQKLRLAKGLDFINEQLPLARGSVTQAEAALEKFRKSQNIVNPEEQAASVSAALNEVRKERQSLQAQSQDLQNQSAVLQRQLGASAQIGLVGSRLSQSSRYQALLNEIQKTELDLAQQRLRFTDGNPVIQNLLAQRQDQVSLLQQEVSRVVGSNSSQSQSSGDRLLKEGQLGGTDLGLVNQLAETEKTLQGTKAREQSLAQTEQKLVTELNRFPGLMSEYNRLQPEVETKRSTLQQLLDARQQLSLENARGGFNWQVVEEPLPGDQIGPNRKQDLLLGVVVGLMLGGVTAFLREALDDAIYSSDDLQRNLEIPMLGMIPALPTTDVNRSVLSLPGQKSQAPVPLTLQILYWPPFREALDLIYKNIQLLNPPEPIHSLVITSALAGEGKSTLSLGLASSAARLHQRVLLIDADLRCPSLHNALSLANEQGFSTLLAEEGTTVMPQTIFTSGAKIDVLTSGPLPIDPVKLLSSPRMAELLAAFQQHYDLVLLDTPPLLGIVDAIQTASFCSGILLLGRIGRVKQTELSQAIRLLGKLNLIGVIANGVNAIEGSYPAYTTQPLDKAFQDYQPLAEQEINITNGY
jgi:polysaccharide biosynthesis transport protein